MQGSLVGGNQNQNTRDSSTPLSYYLSKANDSGVWAESEEDNNLKKFLSDSVLFPNVMVLLGSGCSLYNTKGAPTMGKLWEVCIENKDREEPAPTQVCEVLKGLSYNYKKGSDSSQQLENSCPKNIEILLSKLDSYISAFEHTGKTKEITAAENVRKSCIETIIELCGKNIETTDPVAHTKFIEYLAARGANQPRVKIFTTNYDRFIEKAVSAVNGVVLDGFSFQAPYNFHPDYFRYDIIHRDFKQDEEEDKSIGASRWEVRYVPSVFKLYKMHGSVDWVRGESDVQKVRGFASPENNCIIYPTSKKYQASYTQPYLECISEFQNSLKNPNTVLFIAGFGFNDDHLSEPIVTALKTNPGLRVIIVDPTIKKKWADMKNPTENDFGTYWKQLYKLREEGKDINLINAYFTTFSDNLPPLTAIRKPVNTYNANPRSEEVVKRDNDGR